MRGREKRGEKENERERRREREARSIPKKVQQKSNFTLKVILNKFKQSHRIKIDKQIERQIYGDNRQKERGKKDRA